MNLHDTSLPASGIRALQKLNIVDVEALVSIAATPTGLQALSRVLKTSPEFITDFVSGLQRKDPTLREVKSAIGPVRSMGHRRPTHRKQNKLYTPV